MKIRNRIGPRTLNWDTPASIESHTLVTRVEEVTNPRVELALDSIGREFGEQGRMYQKLEICPERWP